MKKKLNEYSKSLTVGVNDTIDTLLWFAIWGGVIYFLLVVGAMLTSSASAAHPSEIRKHTLRMRADKLREYKENVIAITILAEARGEGEKGMYAVACVIQQRVKNRKLNLVSVCLEKKQFSIWNGERRMPCPCHAIMTSRMMPKFGHLLKTPSAPYAKKLASQIYKGGVLDQSVTKNADHYHSKSVKPYWADKKKQTVKIGNHIFYRLKN
jgi:hypothetical protein|tara:strand:- start:101 stop:730 length:630 start_codon:yes stop_codon:yes gene_type:complete